jgi:hypothetical protein
MLSMIEKHSEPEEIMRSLLLSVVLMPVFASSVHASCSEPREPACISQTWIRCESWEIPSYARDVEHFKQCVRDEARWQWQKAEEARVNAAVARRDAEYAANQAKRDACLARGQSWCP